MTEEKKKTIADNELITALGGIEIEVTYRQLSDFAGTEGALPYQLEQFREKLGTTEIVKVGKIRARNFPRYHIIIDDEERTAEMYCNRAPGWAETLEPESLAKVVDTGQDLNLPLWGAWFRRYMERQEAAAPGFKALIKKGLEGALAAVVKSSKGSASPGSSAQSG
jgi:hypothetical protein